MQKEQEEGKKIFVKLPWLPHMSRLMKLQLLLVCRRKKASIIMSSNLKPSSLFYCHMTVNFLCN